MGQKRIPKLPKEILEEIRQHYELGDPIREIARHYSISDGTIRYHIKTYGWKVNEMGRKLQDIKEKAKELREVTNKRNEEAVKDKLAEILLLQTKVNHFVAKAIDLNLKNLQAIEEEPDFERRIKLAAIMRANLVDLPGIYSKPPQLVDNEPNNEENKPKPIQFYLPDNGRDKKC